MNPDRIFARRALAAMVGSALFAVGASASAINLQQAYEAALKHDPVYRMAYYDSEAGREAKVIGRSALLPAVSASYTANRNRADLTSEVLPGTNRVTHPNYISRSSSVQLRQPLFNLEAWARYRQGLAQADASAERFETQADEVAVRVAGAYFEALYAQDLLTLAKAQRDTYAEQRNVNTRMFEKGEGTRTDMLEVQARLDLAEAQLLEAQDNVTSSRNTLEGIVGGPVDTLAPLAPGFQPQVLAPLDYDAWRAMALANNGDLKAARAAVEVAQQEVNKQRAGHAPRLDLVASYSKNDSETLNTYTQDSVNRSIGVQLSIPLYAGGAVNAVSRQAVAGLSRAKADLDQRTNKVLLELRKSFDGQQSSVLKVAALNKAVASGEALMVATERSIKGGVRINLDLLNAQQQLFTSSRDLANARYAYLLSVLRLRAAAGNLEQEHILAVANYFR